MPLSAPIGAEPLSPALPEANSQTEATAVPTVRLEQYEGPLDALLDLVKRHTLDVLDLSISSVTEQYLESLRETKSRDVELSAEFAHMAATLILLKSRALLPSPPAAADQPDRDPAEDLTERLRDRAMFRQLAQVLQERRSAEENTWTVVEEGLQEGRDGPAELSVGIFDLAQAFGEVLQRIAERPEVEVPEERVTVAAQVQFLKDLLAGSRGPMPLREVLRLQTTADSVVATFLALLELVKKGLVSLRQGETYGEITMWGPARSASRSPADPASGGVGDNP